MREAGVEPEEIQHVLTPHLQVDHVGGHTVRDGNRWVPTFPKARYVFSRAEHGPIPMGVLLKPGQWFVRPPQNSIQTIILQLGTDIP